MSEQHDHGDFWHALHLLARGGEPRPVQRGKYRGQPDWRKPQEPQPLWGERNPWPRVQALLDQFPKPAREAADDDPYVAVRSLLSSLTFWADSYDNRDHLEKRIAELEAELAAESKNTVKLCAQALESFNKYAEEIERLKAQLAEQEQKAKIVEPSS
jgi:hypothetical protein